MILAPLRVGRITLESSDGRLRAVFKALNDPDVRYVVVGGLAVMLHGHARLIVDVSLLKG